MARAERLGARVSHAPRRGYGAALINGIETPASPTTNSVKPWGRTQPSLILSVGDLQRDSVLSLSFTPEPNAAVYILEIADFDDESGDSGDIERRQALGKGDGIHRDQSTSITGGAS